jgi:D-aminopeptidase
LTNTFSVGAVYDAVTRYLIKTAFDGGRNPRWFNPTVGETYDGKLNDAAGLHIKVEHVFAAIENARSGEVEEGNVGAGTGTSACGFKAGIGTSSRCVEITGKVWTVGALVQANFGGDLVIDGVPIGKLLRAEPPSDQTDGSIMVIIATDAPLSSRQLYRLAKRATLGLARVGSDGGHGSGDYFIAFSTTYRRCIATNSIAELALFVRNESLINGLFIATADTVEEAILNSIFKAETMTGRDGRTVPGLPIDQVTHILRQYGKI